MNGPPHDSKRAVEVLFVRLSRRMGPHRPGILQSSTNRGSLPSPPGLVHTPSDTTLREPQQEGEFERVESGFGSGNSCTNKVVYIVDNRIMVCGNALGWNLASIQRNGGGGEVDVVEQVRQDYNLLWFPKGKQRPLDTTHRDAITLGWNPASIQRSGGEGEGVIVRRLYRRGRPPITSPGGETMRRPVSLGS